MLVGGACARVDFPNSCFLGGLFHDRYSNRIFEAMNVTRIRRPQVFSSRERSVAAAVSPCTNDGLLLELGHS